MSAPQPLPPPEWRSPGAPPTPQQVFGPPAQGEEGPDMSRVPVPFTAPPGSKLEQLLAEFERLHGLVSGPNRELEEVKKAVKTEISKQLPEGRYVGVITSPVLSTPVRVRGNTTRRLQGKQLFKDYPKIWWDYSSESTSWTVERASEGGGE